MAEQSLMDELIDLINAAAQFINEGKTIEGRAKLLEIKKKAEESGQLDILPNIHLNLASTWRAEGKQEKAEEELNAASEAAEKYGEAEDRAFVALQRFNFLHANGRHEEAGKEIELALSLMETAASLPLTVRADIQQAAGSHYAGQRELEKSLHLLEEGLRTAEKAGYLYGQGACLSEMGIVYNELLDYDRAAECHQKALAIFQQSKVQEFIAGALHNLGNTELARGNYAAAADYYSRAAEIKIDHAGEPASLESTLCMETVAFANAGNWPRAVDALRAAFMCTLSTGPRRAAYLTSLAHHEIVKPLLNSGGDLKVLQPLANRLRDLAETAAKSIQQEKTNFNAPVGAEEKHDKRLLIFFLLVRYARLLEALAAGKKGPEEQAFAAWLKEVSGEDLDLTHEFPPVEKSSGEREETAAAPKKARQEAKKAENKGKKAGKTAKKQGKKTKK